MLALLISKKPGRFISIMLISNLIADLLIFPLQTHHFYISDNLNLKPDLTILTQNHYGIMISIYNPFRV